MKFRKVMALALAASMAVSLNAVSVLAEGGDTTDITLWTYPVGSWGDSAVVDQMISNFNEAHPEINVTVEYLDYTNGDDQINTAIKADRLLISFWKDRSVWLRTGAQEDLWQIFPICGQTKRKMPFMIQ